MGVLSSTISKLYVSNMGATSKSCYLTTLKQPAKRMPVEEMNPPSRRQRRAQRRALMNEVENEKEEKMMEVSMQELEAKPEDTPRPQPDGETQ